MAKKRQTKSKMKGQGFITDVGGVLLPAVGGVLGTTGGTALGTLAGPVGSAFGGTIGGAVGAEAGKGFNDWLRSLGLGNQRMQGKGWAQDLLKKLVLKGFTEARKVDAMGAKDYITSLYKKWKLSQGGRGYSYKPLMVGSGMTYAYNGTYQQIPKTQRGSGGTAYGMVSSEFGRIQA